MLKEEALTTKEIQEITDYDIKLIWTYISQYKDEDKIKKIDMKGNYPVYKAITQKDNRNIKIYEEIFLSLSLILETKVF